MPPQNTHEIFRKELEMFREKSKKLFTRGGLCAILDYPPHDWVLDEKEVESFLLQSLRRASLAVVEASAEKNRPNACSCAGAKYECEHWGRHECIDDTLATAREITGVNNK